MLIPSVIFIYHEYFPLPDNSILTLPYAHVMDFIR